MTPYEILNISRNSSLTEIKRAFRKMALKYHPDKKGGNKERFIAINTAYCMIKGKATPVKFTGSFYYCIKPDSPITIDIRI